MEAPIQILMMVLLLIVICFVVYELLEGKQTEGVSVKMPEACSTSNDCDNSEYGKLCLSINGGNYQCGCLTNDHCPEGKQCIDSVCK